jgi:hypothetical protein
MQRMVSAVLAATDRTVAIAGPTGAPPEAPAFHHRAKFADGHMTTMI